MTLTRRGFITQSAAITTIASFPQLAHAQLTLGKMRLDVVSDGSLNLPGDFIFGPMPQDELRSVLADYNQPMDELKPPCNVSLLRFDGHVVLFDVGAGSGFTPSTGKLVESLEALDVAPDDVTHVIFTHAHPDHLWGLLDDFDDPLFPQATYRIGRAEWDYWMNPNTVDEIGEAMASFAVGAQRRLALIEDNITFIDDDVELLPGISARATFGHTPGHMSFEVRDGTTSAMIVGDCIGNHHVAFARPYWPSGSDQDRDLAIKTRISLLDQLASAAMPVVGFHLPGAIGRVEKNDDGYIFVSEV